VDPVGGWSTIAASFTLIAVIWFGLRRKMSHLLVDALSALGGLGIGIGGLLLMTDVGAASWVVGPLAMSVMAVLHERALFAGAGPLRT
jgi:hypothetical protein